MYHVTLDFLDAQRRGDRSLLLAEILSAFGRRIYAIVTPTPAHIGGSGGVALYDGSRSVGDSGMFGGGNIVLDWGSYLLSASPLRETLTPNGQDMLAGLTGVEIASVSVQLNNSGSHFSDILADESFLGHTLCLKFGYASLTYSDFVEQFTGRIVKETLSDRALTLDAQVI